MFVTAWNHYFPSSRNVFGLLYHAINVYSQYATLDVFNWCAGYQYREWYTSYTGGYIDWYYFLLSNSSLQGHVQDGYMWAKLSIALLICIVFKENTYELCIYRVTFISEYIIFLIKADGFSIEDRIGYILGLLIYDII